MANTRDNLPLGAKGRLFWRSRPSRLRRAHNLCYYLQQLITRTGLERCTLVVIVHGTVPLRVDINTTAPPRGGRGRGNRAGTVLTGNRPTRTPPKPFSLADVHSLFQLRMTRLLRHYHHDYGRLYIEVVNGQLKRLTPAPDFRATSDEWPLLARFFAEPNGRQSRPPAGGAGGAGGARKPR